MIPLTGTSTFSGGWPEHTGSLIFEVGDKDAQGNLDLECFFGAGERLDATGTFVKGVGANRPTVILPAALGHIQKGDMIAVRGKAGRTRVLFRTASPNNSLLVTERCDNYCVMCSQPPKNVNDDILVDEILALVPRLPKELPEIGFTGGEPTIVGSRFIGVLEACRDHLPTTAVHVLSNGRRFSQADYAAEWASVKHPDLMVGIPIYSDQSHIHDYVVQADGAFDETIRGILQLKSLNQRVEIRIVLHRHTIGRLDRFASFIINNLRFVDHVTLMGLEVMGFAVAHQDDLWIKLSEHSEVISDAVEMLASAGIRTSIYNVPLCLLDERSRPFAVRSISDWKREYWDACEGCSLKSDCGGAFFSSRARLAHEISPIPG
jgi:His-Xaa-Ser system radical SAM maturase HxsC